jgi:hypothetical protein
MVSSPSASARRLSRKVGDLGFAAVLLVLSLVLLSQIGEQTRWIARVPLLAQPGFWPGLSLGSMVLFALVYITGSWRDPERPVRETGTVPELWFWLRSLEYALWFMAYVFIVPLAGYLPSSVIFCTVLAYRAGYREGRVLGAAALLGASVVLLFKSFLQVKIPCGALYEYFPAALRNLLIVYF